MNKSTRKTQGEHQRAVLTALGHDPDTVLQESWWVNPINPNSLRLNKMGVVWFHDIAKIPSHEIQLAHQLTSKHLLQLERLITEPYFIKKSALTTFGEMDAIMLQLHAGNLSAYLNSLDSD